MCVGGPAGPPSVWPDSEVWREGMEVAQVNVGGIVFRVHAVKRMFQRQVSVDDVHKVLEIGEVIEDYPEDTPFPSKLFLGWSEGRPIHVVAASNEASGETIIITVYEPDPNEWEPGFRRRKP